MHLAHQPQRFQEVERAIDGGEADKRVAPLDAPTDLFCAEVFAGLFNDGQDHLALGRQAMALATKGFGGGWKQMLHGGLVGAVDDGSVLCSIIARGSALLK